MGQLNFISYQLLVTSYLVNLILDSFVSLADIDRSLFPLDERTPSFLFCEFNFISLVICVYYSFSQALATNLAGKKVFLTRYIRSQNPPAELLEETQYKKVRNA